MDNSSLSGFALYWIIPVAACASKNTEKNAPQASDVGNVPFLDHFERSTLGPNYLATADNYHVVNGALHAMGARNHPLWLTKKLPRNVSIEFDCWSNSNSGDIKVELFGDGRSHAATKEKVAYSATGYVAIMGGWGNSKSLLARQNEHGIEGNDLSQRTAPKVQVGKQYHWKLTRVDDVVTWYVDDMKTPFLRFRDDEPLEGESQSYFGFNNWQSDTWFDNLQIVAL